MMAYGTDADMLFLGFEILHLQAEIISPSFWITNFFRKKIVVYFDVGPIDSKT